MQHARPHVESNVNAGSFSPYISGNQRYVVFASEANASDSRLATAVSDGGM